MRAFSISKLMLFVGLLAADFSTIRLLLGRKMEDDNWTWLVLAGLVPMVNASLVSSYLLARSYRIRLGRRTRERGSFLRSFALDCWILTTLSVVSLFVARDAYVRAIEFIGTPIFSGLLSLGVDLSGVTRLNRFVLAPAFMGVLVSGPTLLLAGIWAFVRSRVELIVEPRTPAAADSAG